VRRLAACACALAWALAAVPRPRAQSAPAPAEAAASDDASFAGDLAPIREQIESLDFEKALSAIAKFLERPGLPDDVRADALALRGQAHAATGDIDAAEADYKEILPLRPAFEPDPKLTPKRALERFSKLQASTVGTLHLVLDPQDAHVTIEGRPVEPGPGGTLRALAGERALHVERKGFDPLDTTARVVAGQEAILKLRLVPNAGGIVVRTDVAGVTVSIDDRDVGTTVRPPGDPSGPAVLTVLDLALGEHEVHLEKSCFATERVPAMVSVDIDDRAPKPMPIVTMRAARTRVDLAGATYPGEIRIDGEKVATLPAASAETCPGRHTVETVAGGRVVWASTLDTTASELNLDVAPRPNVALVGGEWPASWAAVAGSWSLRGRLDPPDGGNLASAPGWAKVTLPPETDFAVGVIPRGGPAGEDAVVVYSPALGLVEAMATPPPGVAPPWRETTIGAVPVDGPGGAVVLVAVVRGGPAARAGIKEGEALVSVAGVAVSDAAGARARIASQPPGSALPVELGGFGGDHRTVQVIGTARPASSASAAGTSAVIRAAWATVIAAAGGDEAPCALASLAGLLSRYGKDDAAIEAWRKAAALDPATFGPRADYAVGVALDAQGKAAEAKDRFRRAKAGAEAAQDAVLAAAAADRLADLGVASN
jgi:tetratricopeptide (TPR) repeat protein